MGNYYIPISYLIKKITKQQVIIPPKITKKTIELGTTYSPDYVCVPFKYNLGNFIESLNKGANVIFQAGGGCRYGYYAGTGRLISCVKAVRRWYNKNRI